MENKIHFDFDSEDIINSISLCKDMRDFIKEEAMETEGAKETLAAISTAINVMTFFWADKFGVDKMKVKLDPGAFMPDRAHETDAGYDLRTPVCVTISPRGFAVVDTGVHIQLPPGKAAVVVSKSGLYTKHEISSTGLIDEGFTGTIRIGLENHSDEEYTFLRGDKVSQFYITNYYGYDLELVDSLDESSRGDNGYGSTGR